MEDWKSENLTISKVNTNASTHVILIYPTLRFQSRLSNKTQRKLPVWYLSYESVNFTTEIYGLLPHKY